MKRLLPCFLLLFTFLITSGQDAPVITAGNIVVSGDSVTVPVTATDFTNIGSCALRVDYDPDIAAAVTVVAGPLLGGGLNSNLTNPGTIILGWYTWPCVTLPANSVIFLITFTRVSAGFSPLNFVDDGYSCYFSDSSYTILNDLPTEHFYHPGSITFQSEAPVTLAPSLKAAPSSLIDIPVTVSGFSEIGKIDLTMTYDPAILAFQTWTNTAGFPGFAVTETAPGFLFCSGMADSTNQGVTLPDSSVLFTLRFLYSGGSSALTWKTEEGSCAYAGPPPLYLPLADTPKDSFYVNGQVIPGLGIGDNGSRPFSTSFFPNPFRDKGTLCWDAPPTGPVMIQVDDITGRRIAAYYTTAEKTGRQQFDIPGDQLTPGVYILTLIMKPGGQAIRDSFSIIRLP
ncbi:MAG TPA: cohesin domain-containing protein [Bacteroidales bacterium]|nr:cohesin domain-containing protein [Bacteroidales bacterium]